MKRYFKLQPEHLKFLCDTNPSDWETTHFKKHLVVVGDVNADVFPKDDFSNEGRMWGTAEEFLTYKCSKDFFEIYEEISKEQAIQHAKSTLDDPQFEEFLTCIQ